MKQKQQVRPSIRIAAVAVALLLLGLLAATAWTRFQRRAAGEELRLAVGPPESVAYPSPQVPDERNAAIPLRAAAGLLKVPEAQRSALVALTLTPEGGWTASQRELAQHLVAANTAALALLYDAGRLQESGFGLSDPGREAAEVHARLPALELLWAQRLLLADASLAWREGDRSRFAAALAAMTSLAAALEREAPFLANLVGVSAEQMLLALSERTLAHSGCDASTVELLGRSAVREDLHHAWHRVVANEDRLAELSLLQDAQSERATWLDRIARDRERTRQLRVHTALARALDTPYGSSPDWRAEREGEVTRWAPLAVPALIDGAVRFQATLAGRQLTAAALCLRGRALAAGRYPDRLEGCPDAAGPDRFSGRPLLLEAADGGAVTLAVDGGQELWAASPGGASSPMTLALRLPPMHPGS